MEILTNEYLMSITWFITGLVICIVFTLFLILFTKKNKEFSSSDFVMYLIGGNLLCLSFGAVFLYIIVMYVAFIYSPSLLVEKIRGGSIKNKIKRYVK